MREKAIIGDDGSQVSRKGLSAVVRTNLERLEPMPFRARLQDTSNHNPCHLLRTQKLTYMLIHTYVNFTIHILFLSTLHIIFEKRRLL